jgi:hypothetical protein
MAYKEYIVRSPWGKYGDSLSSIAARHGMTLERLFELNPEYKTNPKYKGGNLIWAGDRVVIEHGGRSGPRPTATGTRHSTYVPPKPVWVDPRSGYQKELDALTGPNRNAFTALTNLFTSYGLATLAPKILDYITNGFSSDTITTMLQQTPEYIKRFAGNTQRLKDGLPVLSPADYLATESSYRQILQSAGLPAGFYDKHEDFVDWIGKDVAPTEVKSRADQAVRAVTNAPPEYVHALGMLGIDTGHLVAHFLDSTVALPILQKQAAAAEIGSAAMRSGLVMDPNRAMTFAAMGISPEAATANYQKISYMLPSVQKLGQIYGQSYSQQTAENEMFLGSGAAERQRVQLGQQETAAFAGTTAVNEKSIAQPTVGKF